MRSAHMDAAPTIKPLRAGPVCKHNLCAGTATHQTSIQRYHEAAAQCVQTHKSDWHTICSKPIVQEPCTTSPNATRRTITLNDARQQVRTLLSWRPPIATCVSSNGARDGASSLYNNKSQPCEPMSATHTRSAGPHYLTPWLCNGRVVRPPWPNPHAEDVIKSQGTSALYA